MENNEYEEVLVQSVEQDDRLENAMARNEKLRAVAFESMTEFISKDKFTAILSTCFCIVLFLGLSIGYGWLCSHSEYFEEGQLDLLHGFMMNKAFLFYASMALCIVGALTYLIISLVIHNKLRIKKALLEDVSTSVPRIKSFCKSDVIRTVIFGAFLLLGLVFLCVWLIMLIHAVPNASKGEMAETVAIVIAVVATITLFSVLGSFLETRLFASKCDKLIKMLEI